MREISEAASGYDVIGNNPVNFATKGFYTVDKYNNYSWRDFEYNGKPSFSIFNPEYKGKSDSDIRDDLKKWTSNLNYNNEVDKSYVLDYQEKLLAHPSYSPILTYHESDEFIKERTGCKENTPKGRFELQTRRACKFGLEYISKKEDGKIAFLRSIDGENMPENDIAILNKEPTKDRANGRTSDTERVPITTSELLKAYRLNMNQNKIYFFDQEGKKIDAPWVKEQKEKKSGKDENTDKISTWAQYNEKRKNKYIKLASDLNVEFSTDEINAIKEKVINKLREQISDESSPSELLYKYSKNLLRQTEG